MTSGQVTPAAAESTNDLFEQYEVATGTAMRQTVVSGFFLGGAVAELAVLNVDENNDRRLRIYAFGDDTWVPRLDAALRPEVSFVDVADIGGRDRLVTYGGGRLNWFDPESATERALVAVASSFKPPARGEILHVDITHDVNHDDRDDLVVPHLHGFWVLIQMSDGAFADPVKVGPSIGMGRIYGADGYRYDPWVEGGRVHEMDYNRDGLSDLVFWKEDHFEVHLQDQRGLFEPVARTFTTDVAFDSDEFRSLATRNMTGKVLYSLADLNGDGVADLTAFSLAGESLLGKHSTYEVHFGTPTADGGTVFARGVDTAIQADGIQLGMERHDFDRDGQVDIMVTTNNIGIFKIVGALLTGSMSLELEFYRMEGGIYPGKPNATRRIRGDFTEDGYYPAVLIADVNGDGRSDLLVQKGRKELRVFLGVPGPKLFARQPRRVAVAMPDDEEYTWLVDLNKDGKQDLLMHHPSTSGPHRLTLLIAR